jgi:hypothetical protein
MIRTPNMPTSEPTDQMMIITQRDDGMYQIIIGDHALGWFETRAFAEAVAAQTTKHPKPVSDACRYVYEPEKAVYPSSGTHDQHRTWSPRDQDWTLAMVGAEIRGRSGSTDHPLSEQAEASIRPHGRWRAMRVCSDPNNIPFAQKLQRRQRTTARRKPRDDSQADLFDEYFNPSSQADGGAWSQELPSADPSGISNKGR